jgi:hypothetical protein
MSDFSNGGWGTIGFAANDEALLTASYVAFLVGKDAAVKRSQGIPDDGHIYDVLFELSVMSAVAPSPTEISFYIARDAAGTMPLTEVYTVPIVKALLAAAVTGGARQRVEVDFHSKVPVGARQFNDLYVIAKLDAVTATAIIRVNWRG